MICICCFYVFIVTQSSARFHSRNMMRKETENLPTTFENEESIVKHAFDTKVKARGRCRYSFSFGNFIINIQKFCKSSRVETELGVVVTAVQPPN